MKETQWERKCENGEGNKIYVYNRKWNAEKIAKPVKK